MPENLPSQIIQKTKLIRVQIDTLNAVIARRDRDLAEVRSELARERAAFHWYKFAIGIVLGIIIGLAIAAAHYRHG